jgi:hypothetical protein
MLKIVAFSLTFFCIILYSCKNNYHKRDIEADCEILSMVFDTFMQINKNEFKYMDIDRHYISQFSESIDTNNLMLNFPKLDESSFIKLDTNELIKIGKQCLNLPNTKYIDRLAMLDTMSTTQTTIKVIWGIANYQRNSQYANLIFGAFFSSRAMIYGLFKLEINNGNYKIIRYEPGPII